MNVLGIDWGEKRIGLAFADSLAIAVPIEPAVQKKLKERLAHIEKEIKQRKVQAIAIGYPLNMDGTVGFKAKEVDVFIEKLEKRFHLPITRIDERLTSHLVEEDYKGGKKKIDPKSGAIDSSAACIILKDFLGFSGDLQIS
ncbi:MAG: Holliday junction resolvase RuvX [Opitutae bacterium]|nr:Holliday junction resolvase RuvX [Opitutae bacterium]